MFIGMSAKSVHHSIVKHSNAESSSGRPNSAPEKKKHQFAGSSTKSSQNSVVKRQMPNHRREALLHLLRKRNACLQWKKKCLDAEIQSGCHKRSPKARSHLDVASTSQMRSLRRFTRKMRNILKKSTKCCCTGGRRKVQPQHLRSCTMPCAMSL